MPGLCRRVQGDLHSNGSLPGKALSERSFTPGGNGGQALSERSCTPSGMAQSGLLPVGTGQCWWPRSGVNHLMAETSASHTHEPASWCASPQSSRGKWMFPRIQRSWSFPQNKPSVGLEAGSTRPNQGSNHTLRCDTTSVP